MKNKWVPILNFNANYDASAKLIYTNNNTIPPNQFIKQFSDSLLPHLKLDKVFYDLQGFYLLKLIFKCNKEGYLQMDDSFKIDLLIKAKNEVLENEVKKNCLIFDHSNKLEVSIGDEIIIYISKLIE